MIGWTEIKGFQGAGEWMSTEQIEERDGKFFRHVRNCLTENCACVSHPTWFEPVEITEQEARAAIKATGG